MEKVIDNIPLSGTEMWEGRALEFTSALNATLDYLQDHKFIIKDSKTFGEFLELEKLETLVFAHNGIYGVNFDSIAQPLHDYLMKLPRFNPELVGHSKQDAITYEQHGFITMDLCN